MHISVNGRFESQRVTGVERYALAVMARSSQLATVVAPRRPARGLRGHMWEQSVLPTQIGRNLLWSPCNTGPLAVARQVVTIHDCAFHDTPEGFSRRFAAWYRWLVPRLARRIRRVITVSQFSRDRLLEYCRIPEEKVVVIPQGVDERFRPMRPEDIARTRRELGLPQRYILHVGSLVPHKNLPRLLEAWKMVGPEYPDTSLVLVGATNGVFRGSGLGQLDSSVVSLGYVADEHLPAVYGGAELFVFPSLYEGFGLPVLEAMACGVPVLTSNVTALPEVAGDAALLVDPYSSESLAEGLRRLMSDSALRAELVCRGLERARSFNWDRTAAATWRVLAETALTEDRSLSMTLPSKRIGGTTKRSIRSTNRPSIKILHIVGLAHGGAGQHVLSLASGCDPRCFQSTVVMAAENPMRAQFERAGVRVLALEVNQYDWPRKNIAAFRQLSDILRREPFDLINTHTMVPSVLGRVAARRHTQAPVVHMLHAFAGQKFRSRLSRQAALLMERRMDRLTDWYIAGSQAMIDRGVSRRIFTADKVVLIPNGVDLRSFDCEGNDSSAAQQPSSEQACVTVGFLGRLDKQKGVEHLIRAAALVRRINPRIKFRIGGDGPLRGELETLAARLQVNDVVEFAGWQRDRIRFLREIDFMAMPSIWEAFGLSAAEAMTLEKPVIASRIEGLPEVIGETGILVPPANPDSLASAIVELAADSARQRALGRQARARVEERFTLDLMISRHQEFYKRVVDGGTLQRVVVDGLSPELKAVADCIGDSSCELLNDPQMANTTSVEPESRRNGVPHNSAGRLTNNPRLELHDDTAQPTH